MTTQRNGGNRFLKPVFFAVFIFAVASVVVFFLATAGNKTTGLNPQSGVKLVDNFPPTPVYPGAVLVSSSKGPPDSDPEAWVLFTGTWETTAAVPETVNWYVTNLKPYGWEIDVPSMDPQDPKLQFLSFINKEGKYIKLSVIKEENTDKNEIVVDFLGKATEPGEEN